MTGPAGERARVRKGKANARCETCRAPLAACEAAPLGSAYAKGVSALLWWLIPIGATVLAVAWAIYRARPERPTEAIEGMEHLRRMQLAMERPLPQEQADKARRRRGVGRGRDEDEADPSSPAGPPA